MKQPSVYDGLKEKIETLRPEDIEEEILDADLRGEITLEETQKLFLLLSHGQSCTPS